MRRAVLAVLGTIAGTTVLVGAKVGMRPAVEAATIDAGGSPAPSGAIAGGSSTPGVPPRSATTGHGTPKPAASPGSSHSSAPAPTSTGPPSGTFRGGAVDVKDGGAVTVTITVSAGRITGVTDTYTGTGTSATIAKRAEPKLRQEALAAQSANIATVSGATDFSDSFKSSLRSAINASHA